MPLRLALCVSRVVGCLLVLTAAWVGVTAGFANGDAARADEHGKLHEVEIQENVEYGTGGEEKLRLHLARPKGVTDKVPGVIFIHGGGWQAGDKNMFKQSAKEAAARGFVAVTIGYRFAPKSPFPAQIEDSKCAVRWMRAHADELGVDPQRIGAVGLSAGAHLAIMLGVMDSSDGLEGNGGWADQSSKVQAVVSYFGPTNLHQVDINKTVAKKYLQEPVIRGILTNFVGGGRPEDHLDLLRQASPVTYINEGDAPMLLFQGTRDPLVPYDQMFEMATALTEAGVPGRIELLLLKSHGWGGEELARTQAAAFDFLRLNLSPAKKRKSREAETAAAGG